MQRMHTQPWQSPPCLHKVISIEDDIPALVNDAEMALMLVHPALLTAQDAHLVRSCGAQLWPRPLRTAQPDECQSLHDLGLDIKAACKLDKKGGRFHAVPVLEG